MDDAEPKKCISGSVADLERREELRQWLVDANPSVSLRLRESGILEAGPIVPFNKLWDDGDFYFDSAGPRSLYLIRFCRAIQEELQLALPNMLTYIARFFPGLAMLQVDYHTKMGALPSDVGCFVDILSLSLPGNGLRTLPPEIGELARLEILDLCDNYLDKIPEEIFLLARLRELDWGNNGLQTIPEGIGRLTLLQELHLEENQLQELPPSFAQLGCLDKLYLHRNRFRSIPVVLFQLTKLRVLELDNNHIQELPAEIIQCTALVELKLAQNQLQSVPKEVFELPLLNFIGLWDNQLTCLPAEILPALRFVEKKRTSRMENGRLVHDRKLEFAGYYGWGPGVRLAVAGNPFTELPPLIAEALYQPSLV